MQTDLYDTMRAYNIAVNKEKPKKYYIKGNRKGRSVFDNFFTVGMSFFETLVLRKAMWDINAQPNFFHKSFLKKIKNPPKDFSFDLYFYYTAKTLGYRILRFPVVFKERAHGVSHWNTGFKEKIKFIKRTVDFTFKLKRMLKND